MGFLGEIVGGWGWGRGWGRRLVGGEYPRGCCIVNLG